MNEIAFHPVSELFPLMTGASFDELVADIKVNGLREEIWLWKEKIIDGRNRYNACAKAGIKPRFREWDGDGDVTKFVVSLNLHRRHLNESQRAMIAAKVANVPQNNSKKPSSIDLGLGSTPINQETAGEMLNVSVPSIKRALTVRRNGVPELVRAVEDGSVSVTAAQDVSNLPPDEQREIMKAGPTAIKQKAKELRPRRERASKASCLQTRTRRMNGRKAPAAIRAAIGTLVGLAMGLEDFHVKDAAPSAEEAEQWEKELASVISAINRFRKQLKEVAHV